MHRRLLVAIVLLAALSGPAPAEAAGARVLCNTFGEHVTYATPKARPRACAVWPEGVPHYLALTFVKAEWRGWGSSRAVASVTLTGNMGARVPGTVVLTRLRRHCGHLVYTRARIRGGRRVYRPNVCALTRGERFCGWRDYESGGWTMRRPEPGAFFRVFARRMSCRTARRASQDVEYPSSPPYRPFVPGYHCREILDGYEYSDVRCRRAGARTRSFRFQTGA
jgi:hypothetical protein